MAFFFSSSSLTASFTRFTTISSEIYSSRFTVRPPFSFSCLFDHGNFIDLA